MILNLALQVRIDILSAAVRLVFNPPDQIEPLLKLLLVDTIVLAFDRDNDVLELVHQDGEESNAKDLNDAAENLLHN